MILHFSGNGEQVQVKKTTNTQTDSGSGEIKSDMPKREGIYVILFCALEKVFSI